VSGKSRILAIDISTPRYAVALRNFSERIAWKALIFQSD
jgi:hypothetical protein